MRTRLQDIAEDLKLSKMTISRVLRGQTDVSEQTKARVLQRMQELNYRPNASARGLRTGQAFRVGIVVPRITDPHYAAICQGLITVFQAAGYGVAVSTTDAQPESEESEIELHLSRHIDAIFLIGPGGPSLATALMDSEVHSFLLGRKTTGKGVFALGYDEAEVGRQPAAYLLARGARRIAYLRGPRTVIADERFSGFLRAHREASVTPVHEWAREARRTETEYRSGYETITALLHARLAPDAAMANSDALAAGACDAALAHGLDVPNAFQVIGCGDDALLCSLGMPLTSMSFPGEQLGARAARLAIDVIANHEAQPARAVLLNPTLVARSTTRKLESKGRVRKVFEKERLHAD